MKILILLIITLIFPKPAYAVVDIGQAFGFGGIKSVGDVASILAPPVFAVVAASVVLYFLWGAFKWMVSAGDKNAIADAQRTIYHSVIGFILLMFAFFLVQFLLYALFGINNLQLLGV